MIHHKERKVHEENFLRNPLRLSVLQNADLHLINFLPKKDHYNHRASSIRQNLLFVFAYQSVGKGGFQRKDHLHQF